MSTANSFDFLKSRTMSQERGYLVFFKKYVLCLSSRLAVSGWCCNSASTIVSPDSSIPSLVQTVDTQYRLLFSAQTYTYLQSTRYPDHLSSSDWRQLSLPDERHPPRQGRSARHIQPHCQAALGILHSVQSQRRVKSQA